MKNCFTEIQSEAGTGLSCNAYQSCFIACEKSANRFACKKNCESDAAPGVSLAFLGIENCLVDPEICGPDCL